MESAKEHNVSPNTIGSAASDAKSRSNFANIRILGKHWHVERTFFNHSIAAFGLSRAM
jgi:hypothetical protein